jgi:lysophospholipase L1-like esterase
LADIIANAQPEPLDYANLGVRGLRLSQIRISQLDVALAMRPDLLSVFAGANDLLSVECDFSAIEADLAMIFGEACAQDCTVVTFTMPDPSSVNPFGRRLRTRMMRFNDIVRAEADRYGVLVMDFQRYPVVEDPRLFSEDRLHGNELGHERVAAAMAWQLGIDGADESWANPLPDTPQKVRSRAHLAEDVRWARRYFAPWLGRGIRGGSTGAGFAAKRPVLTPVPRSQT